MDPPALVRHFSVRAFESDKADRIIDTVAAEEPLEVRVQHFFKALASIESFAVTMRTPGYDRELTAGLLVSEGVIRRCEELVDLRALGCGPSNEILAQLAESVDFEGWRAARNGIMSSSCGICGRRSRESILQDLPAIAASNFRVSHSFVMSLPELLLSKQPFFDQTGGLHAAAFVNGCGEVEVCFEDIGRHNALDKVIGWALLNRRLPLGTGVLFLSSRSSFELVQKAVMAGAPILATVGAPSSLAIETARDLGLTLIGFVRGARFNVYAGEWRINSE